MGRERINLDGGGTLKRPRTCEHDDDCSCPWIAEYRDENSRQKERTFSKANTSAKNKAAARAFLNEVNHAKATTDHIPGHLKARNNAPTVAEAMAEWLERRRDLKQTTRDGYRRKITYWLTPLIGDRNIARVTRKDVEALISTLYEQGRHAQDVIVCVGTILKAVMELAIAESWRAGNPCTDLNFHEVVIRKRRLPADGEIAATMELLPQHWKLAVVLMSGLGLRMGEMLATDRNCVQGDRFRVHRQWLQTSDYGPLKYKKTDEFREIPLPPEVLAEIERHCEKRSIAEGPLFESSKVAGVPYATQTWKEELHQARLQLGITRGGSHDYRHWWATQLLVDKTPVTDVSQWLGHATIDTTYRTYAHLIDRSWEEGRRSSSVVARRFLMA